MELTGSVADIGANQMCPSVVVFDTGLLIPIHCIVVEQLKFDFVPALLLIAEY